MRDLKVVEAILHQVAINLGPGAVMQRTEEHALIATSPYGLLLDIDSVVGGVQPYCAVYDIETLDLSSAQQLGFHQRGQPFSRNSWVWFPYLSPVAATDYQIRRRLSIRNRFEWRENRVLPALETSAVAQNRKQLVEDVGARIASDFRELRSKLDAEIGSVR